MGTLARRGLVDPLDQGRQVQVLGPDASQRRKDTMEDVIGALELPGAFDGQQIGHAFDDADKPSVSTRINADLAQLITAQMLANTAETGNKPPEIALPNINTSGLTPS